MKRAVTLLLTFALLAVGTTAGASNPASGDTTTPPKDPKKERDKVRRDKANAAAKLDALQSDAADVDKALDELQGYIEYQQNQLDDAKAAQEESARQVVNAQQDVAEIQRQIDALQVGVKDAVIRAYTSAGSQPNVFSNLLSSSPEDELQKSVLYDLATGDVTDALDELESKHLELTAATRRAEKAAQRADTHRVEVEGKIADLEDAITKQQELSDSVDSRIDDTLSEAAGLEQLDATLSQQIVEREQALAAKAKRDAEAAKAKSHVKTATVTDEGNITVPVIPTATNGLVRVNGITVDASIGPAIAQLVAWAAEDGFNLSGGGFRSAQDQIDTRRANCGSSTYDVWQKPPSACHPPAARPGHSMHEKGLAVDFACDGALIATYSSSCYAWMAAHAPRVGLKNRRGEAWHWSTNGN